MPTIEDYSKAYFEAKAAGDAAGMQAANDGANALRAAAGQTVQVASQDIANVAAQSAPQSTVTAPAASAQTQTLAVPPSSTQTQTIQYTDANGVNKTGYVKNGLTYVDPNFTQRVGVGSVVNTQGGAYVMTENGGVPYAEYMASLQNKTVPQANTSDYLSMINQLTSAAARQSNAQIDYATQQGVNDLQRALEDAQTQYQTQRNQTAIDEKQSLDNSALYAEARGDKGGIGQAQYNEIQNTAAQNRLTINQAQTKLSTDTARQIADLRAQGEFEKADALLTLTQNQLSQMMSLEQWAAEYNMSAAQLQAQLDQFEQSYALDLANITGTMADGTPTYTAQQNAQSQLASMGEAFINAGLLPTADQLAALGITAEQAQALINANKLAAASEPSEDKTSDGLLKTVKTTDSEYKNAKAMIDNDDYEAAAEYIASVYSGSAAKTAAAMLGCSEEYAAYVGAQDTLEAVEDGVSPSEVITNKSGANNDGTLGWVHVPGYGRLSASELADLVDSGKVKETYNSSTKKYTYTAVQ